MQAAAAPPPTATSQVKPFLELRSVSKTFAGVRALRAVDFDVRPGEVHCLVGENGSGKSTMIKLIAGVLAPDAGGRISIAGAERQSLTPALSKAAGVEVIYQDLSLFPNLTVEENIGFPMMTGNVARLVPRRAMDRSARAVVARLGFDLPLGARVADLAIGERQLVAICRSLAADARLVIMDEPTASLSRSEVRVLIDVVRRLKADGIAVIFVSHKLDEITEIAERVTVLRDGEKVGTYPADEMDAARIEELMLGRRLAHRPPAAREFGDTMLSVTGLTREGEYEDVSLSLRAGEVVGIIGLLGAGRTELALTLAGVTPPDRGTIEMLGKPVRFRSNRDAIKAGIAYLSEDRLTLGLHLTQPIALNAVISVLPSLGGRSGIISPRARREVAASWIEKLRVKIPGLDAAVNQLSGGNQQRVALAKWLATGPRILILDSPTVGVDIGNKEGIYAIVDSLREHGMAVLIISDETGEVFATSDRILHMRDGRIVEAFDPATTTEAELREAVYG